MTPRRSCPPAAPSLGPGLRIHQTWQSTICAPSLLGQCPGPCPLHHAPFPYHWQLLRRRAGHWESLPDLAQDQLERLYCAGAPSAQLGRSNADPCVLDLNGCRVDSLDFERWRRLTTSSSPQDSPHFYTQWITYRGSEGRWCPYQEPLASEIEASYLRGEKRFHFALEDCTYVINWVSLSESNLTRAGYRKICRRPRYRSLLEMAPYLRTLTPMDGPREPIHHRPGPVAGTVSATATAPPVELPPSWAQAPDPSLVPLSVSDAEYQMVYWTFHQTLAESRFIVVRICRVQNAALWQKYVKRRSEIQEELGDSFPSGSWDRHLFHGTSEPCARSICRSNFDPGLAGRHGARYGRGACFAAAASYAHAFASPSAAPPVARRRMFLAKVLTGRCALGRPHLAGPPLLGPGLPGNSCVDSLEEPAIFVVFDSAQCYPYWLIEYQAVTSILLD